MADHTYFANLIWQIADLLRGPYRPPQNLREHHAEARLYVYEQGYNRRAFATAASDMLMKEVSHNGGGNNVRFGDTFTDDQFPREIFDYFLTNPPFGMPVPPPDEQRARAYERARLDPAELALRIPQLPAWERGEAQPTLKQLEGFAKATHTPIGFLFLPEPPVERVPIPDFRTVASRRIDRPSPDLLDTVYLCQQRQEWYRNFARAMGEPTLPFVGSAHTTGDVVATAAQMRHALGFDLDEQLS
jgi:transcriptional regulator with XRE-family HTH domain